MSVAAELVRTVEANGGQIRIEDGCLVIAPGEAAEPVMDELRENKAAIIALLSARPVLQEQPADDPAAWRAVFRQWMTGQCVSKDRCFGGIGCLHIHFAEWAIAHHAVPCTRPTFEVLLEDAGFLLCDGMVSGLILAEDWQAAHWRPDPRKPVDLKRKAMAARAVSDPTRRASPAPSADVRGAVRKLSAKGDSN